MITSMAIVKARGEIAQPTMMPASGSCHVVEKSAVQLLSLLLGNGPWLKKKKVKGLPEEFMGK